MSPLASFLTGPIVSYFLQYGALVALYLGVAAAIAAYVYYRPGPLFKKRIWQLLLAVLGVRVGIALVSTVLQYFLWVQNPLTARFLPPYQSWSYFMGYVGTRFWTSVLLALLLTALWYGFMWLLGKRTQRFFDTGEKALGALTLFIAGWPLALVYVPLLFIFVLLVSVFRMVVWKEYYTTLGIPMLAAAVVSLVFGARIAGLF